MSEQVKIKIKFWAVTGIVFGLILSRLLPHLDNFTPIVAASLFGGAYFSNRGIAFFVPLCAMLISDIVLELFTPMRGIHSLMPVVYSCFAFFVLLGIWLRRYRAFYAPWLMAILASTLFFITTNFAVWAGSSLYPPTLEGLITCYIVAVPFYGNQLVGNLFYTIGIFGLWRLAMRHFAVLSYERR